MKYDLITLLINIITNRNRNMIYKKQLNLIESNDDKK